MIINLLKGCCQRILQVLFASFAPVEAVRRAEGKVARQVVVAIHVVFLLVALTGLVFAQGFFQLETYVRSSLPLIRELWLPLVGILAYSTAWSAWLIARTLRQTVAKPLFDSVTTSLQSGIDRFTRAGIDPSNTPLYLVLGAPAGGIREFFSAGHVDLVVCPTAEEANEPVQVCGNRDAIYVCCRDSSLIGNYSRKAADARMNAVVEANAASSQINVASVNRESLPAWRLGRSSATVGNSASQASVGAESLQASSSTEASTIAPPMTIETIGDATISRVRQTLDHLEVMTSAEAVSSPMIAATSILQPHRPKATALRLEAPEADALLERLDAICRHLVDLREPYCPINGVVVMIPLYVADNVEASDHVGMRLERDLATIVNATESHLSAQVIFCDLDLCDGSQPFLDRFPDNQRHRRLGTTIPATPTSEPNASASSIDRAVRWICEELFPPLSYRLMARDLSDSAEDRRLCLGNHRIQQLVQQMAQRREGISRMLRRSIANAGDHIRIRGCFLAATGLAGYASRQAFCEGVFPIILDMQNEVQWSLERRVRDRLHKRAAILTYVIVAAAAAATVLWTLGSK